MQAAWWWCLYSISWSIDIDVHQFLEIGSDFRAFCGAHWEPASFTPEVHVIGEIAAYQADWFGLGGRSGNRWKISHNQLQRLDIPDGNEVSSKVITDPDLERAAVHLLPIPCHKQMGTQVVVTTIIQSTVVWTLRFTGSHAEKADFVFFHFHCEFLDNVRTWISCNLQGRVCL